MPRKSTSILDFIAVAVTGGLSAGLTASVFLPDDEYREFFLGTLTFLGCCVSFLMFDVRHI